MSSAGGKGSHLSVPLEAANDRAPRSLLNKEAPRRAQKQDLLLERVRSHLLHQEVNTDPEGDLDIEIDLLYGRDRLWYAPARTVRPTLAIRRAQASDLIALVHVIHGHPGVAFTLTLLREHFHWPIMMRGVQEYVHHWPMETRALDEPEGRHLAW